MKRALSCFFLPLLLCSTINAYDFSNSKWKMTFTGQIPKESGIKAETGFYLLRGGLFEECSDSFFSVNRVEPRLRWIIEEDMFSLVPLDENGSGPIKNVVLIEADIITGSLMEGYYVSEDYPVRIERITPVEIIPQMDLLPITFSNGFDFDCSVRLRLGSFNFNLGYSDGIPGIADTGPSYDGRYSDGSGSENADEYSVSTNGKYIYLGGGYYFPKWLESDVGYIFTNFGLDYYQPLSETDFYGYRGDINPRVSRYIPAVKLKTGIVIVLTKVTCVSVELGLYDIVSFNGLQPVSSALLPYFSFGFPIKLR